MPVFRIWTVLYLLCLVAASMCVNDIEYEGNYADIYDNEISQDQQEGVSPTPCKAPEFSRWDKLFIALEDSHMRQNMLLESLEQCCGGMVHLKTRVDKLASVDTCQQCVHGMESACRAQAEQVNLRLQRELEELRDEEAEREMRLNATLQMLLRSNHEGYARLMRLEEDRAVSSGAADSRMRHQPTPRPGGLGSTFSLGVEPFSSGPREQEGAAPLDMRTVERAMVAIATELERVHLKLSRVIEQGGTQGNNRGDT